MKTILIIITSIFLTNTVYANELSWVDEQIEAIKPPRKSARILSLNNPFIFLEKNGYIKPEVKEKPLENSSSSSDTNATIKNTNIDKKDTLLLSTVINSSAMINGSWYQKNSKINGYTIIELTKTSVTLKKGDKKLILSTNTKKPNLKFKNK